MTFCLSSTPAGAVRYHQLTGDPRMLITVLKRGREIDQSFRDYVAAVLAGEINIPKKRGRKADANAVRDALIAYRFEEALAIARARRTLEALTEEGQGKPDTNATPSRHADDNEAERSGADWEACVALSKRNWHGARLSPEAIRSIVRKARKGLREREMTGSDQGQEFCRFVPPDSP